MPELEVVFIDPKDALGELVVQATPAVLVGEDLGPSGPHQFDEPLQAKLQIAVVGQPLAMSPGSPPLVSSPHYTEVLDEIWPELDDPEERTAARLSSLLELKTQAVGYLCDAGAAFPVAGIKGSPMALAVRLEDIDAGTHGALTFGWTTRRSR